MSALSSFASAALNKLTEHDARTLLLELGAVAALRAFDKAATHYLQRIHSEKTKS